MRNTHDKIIHSLRIIRENIMAKKKAFFKAKELMPDIYAITGAAVVRYLLVGKTHALLFDTGYGLENLKDFVRTITDLPLYVVVSHGHVDHAGGLHNFEEPVYIHQDDIPVYKAHQERAFKQIFLSTLKKMQKVFFFIRFMPKKLDDNAYLDAPLSDNFVTVEEGHIFDLGGLTAEVVEIPGHTPGSIALLCKEKRLLFASDGICRGTYLFLPESCKLSVYRNSLQKAKELDFDYLLIGHLTALHPKSVLKDYIAVANNPDFVNGKVMPEAEYAPGVKYKTCKEAAKNGKKTKNKAFIVISEEKLD